MKTEPNLIITLYRLQKLCQADDLKYLLFLKRKMKKKKL